MKKQNGKPRNGNKKNGDQPIVGAAVSYGQIQKKGKVKESRTDNSRRIKNRELIGSVSGSVAFSSSRYPLNPGLSGTFPWLSGQASSWEMYRFYSLRFDYITRTATDEKGSVILTPDYDPRDVTPTTEAQATNNQDAIEGSVWQQISCQLDPKSMHGNAPRKFIRSGNVAGDLRNFDVGSFFLSTVEEDSSDPIGKLWVEYDVELYIPQNSPSASSSSNQTTLRTGVLAQTFANGVAEAMDFEQVVYDPLNIASPTAGVFTPPAGCYLIQVNASFSNSAAELTSCQMEILKNAASLSPAITAYYVSTTGNKYHLSLSGIVPCDGTDVFSIVATMTGATGTLTSVANTPQLLITMA